jgi:hypothetical protein
MLEQELFAFLERTSDGAFADTEHGEIRSWNGPANALRIPGIGTSEPHVP